ncbi:MAG: metallophosphoesterase [Dehalococcoidia bacterium]
MTDEEIADLLDEAEKRFAAESRLVELDSGRAVFVGDTHGDIEATERIMHKYLRADNTVVFLGDYVDRGSTSLENINVLLEQKIKHPDHLVLLMGNHEGYTVKSFQPASFWEGLDDELRRRYGEVLRNLPLAVSTQNGIVAVHGGLPDVPDLESIARIEPGSTEWNQLTWGDWQECGGADLGADPHTGRPQFGRGWFDDIMSRLGKNLLVRSHQPEAPRLMYDRRCLTIFTSSSSSYYTGERTIAVVDLSREVRNADDVRIEIV